MIFYPGKSAGEFQRRQIFTKMENKKPFIPFSQIIGQEKAVTALKRAITREKIPHAYLFVGIPGTGKTTTALALLQTLNCLEPADGDGCGHCPACRLIISGNFPDIHVIKPDGNTIKIDQIRELNRQYGFKPFKGPYRMGVIQEAEKMTEEAANAFLKTLEEPPENNILILNVTEPRNMLPTIVSRCQKVAFRPVPSPLITQWLQDHRNADINTARLIAKIAEGSLGRAVRLLESEFLEKRQEYLYKLLHLPELNDPETINLAMEYSSRWKRKTADKTETEVGGAFDFISIWKSWYRDLLLIKTSGSEELLINIDFAHKLKNFSKNFTVEHLCESFMILDQAQRDLKRTRNLDLMLENTFLAVKRIACRTAPCVA